MVGELSANAVVAGGIFDAQAAENGGIFLRLGEKAGSIATAMGLAGPDSGVIETVLIVVAACLIAGLAISIGLRATRAFKRKSPEKLAGEMIDNHIAFVQKFVDEMQVALSAGPMNSTSAEGPMKVLMDKSEASWEQVAKLGQQDPGIERAFYAYLNSLKRLSVMEKAVLARTEIAELDTTDFEFQHPIAEAAAGLRVLSRAMGRAGTSKKDRLARYELTALSEDAEVIWDELKARAEANDLIPDIVLRSQSNDREEQESDALEDRPMPHVEERAEPRFAVNEDVAAADDLLEKSFDDRHPSTADDGVVRSGALSGYEIVDDANRRSRRRRRRR